MPRRLLLAFLLLLVVTAKGYIQVSDTVASYETAESLVARHALDVPYSDGYCIRGPDGRAYSKYGIGLALAFVPEVAAAHLLEHASHLPERELAGFFISFLNVPFALILLTSFARTLRRFGVEQAPLVLLTVALGLGTIMWSYAVSDFSEEMQAALLFLAFERATTKGARGAAWSGAAAGALVVVKTVNVMFLPIIALYLFGTTPRAPGSRREALRRVALFSAAPAAGIALLLVLNYVRFRNPLESGYGSEASAFSAAQLVHTVPALIASADQGMFVFSPILIIGVLGWRTFFRRLPAEALVSAAFVVVDLFVKGAWHSWNGGWCWGPRMLVGTLPFWLLPGAFSLANGRRSLRLALASAATIGSIVWQLGGVLVKNQEIMHVRRNVLTETEERSMPPDSIAVWFFLGHKLRGLAEVYDGPSLGVTTDRTIDLTPYVTFHGLNTWPTLTAERLHRPKLAWLLPLGFLAAAALFARQLLERRGPSMLLPDPKAPSTD